MHTGTSYLPDEQLNRHRPRTGMYVRKEDIFSAIYHQLKLFVKANSGFNANYYAKKGELDAMHKVLRKELPLMEILDCIDSIVVSGGGRLK